MDKMDVRIVELQPMRVAAALGYGKGPEEIAWTKLLSWANAQGLLDDLSTVEFYGFNNPNPSPGSPNYGYEQWLKVTPGVQGTDDIEIKDFTGGLYAVTRCQLRTIGEKWHALVAWREASDYRSGAHQWLEKAVTPFRVFPAEDVIMDQELDLYLPITK